MKITFNKSIPTAKGILFGIKITRSNELSLAIVENQVLMTANEAHQKLGHISWKSIKAISNNLGWKIQGTTTQYETFAIGK